MTNVWKVDEPSFRRDLFTESLMQEVERDVKRAIPASKSAMELEQEITFWQARETAAIAQLSDAELRVVQGFHSVRPSRYLAQKKADVILKKRDPSVQA